jgi:hypothetical protein
LIELREQGEDEMEILIEKERYWEGRNLSEKFEDIECDRERVAVSNVWDWSGVFLDHFGMQSSRSWGYWLINSELETFSKWQSSNHPRKYRGRLM